MVLDRLGDLAIFAGDVAKARSSYQKALDLREAMPEAVRNSPDGLRSRSVSQNKLGDLALKLGQLNEAQAAFERGLALAENDQDPDAQRHRFDLRFSYSRLGDVALAGFNLDAADRAYRKALTFAEEQIAADPTDVRARREVPVCYFEARRCGPAPGRLCRCLPTTGNISRAARPWLQPTRIVQRHAGT